jgi:hypothetical protein
MAFLDLVEITNNLPNKIAESITSGPWHIADSHEGLFLLVYCQQGHTERCTSWPALAIFNALTCDLWKHPPTPNMCHCVGAAMLHDGTGHGRFLLPKGAFMVLPFCVLTFKVGVCNLVLCAWCGK